MHHLAIDLGGRESQLCLRQPNGDIVEQRRVRTDQLAKVFAQVPRSRVVLETCAEAFCVADLARLAGHEPCVAASSLVKALGVGARGIKSDQRDAQVLSDVSCRIEVPSVHIPSLMARERKSMVGSRDVLVKSRTTLINNVRGFLRGRLVKIASGATETFPARARKALEKHPDGVPVFIERLLQSIDDLNDHIAEASAELVELAKADPVCQLLMTMPGVGPVTSISYCAALDDISRFPGAHAVESYLGLTPGEHSSGQKKRRTAITKAGAAATRRLLMQSAWCMWRTRPHDPAVLWAKQIEKRRGRRIAIVALSRKLAGILFAMWKSGRAYNPALSAEPTT